MTTETNARRLETLVVDAAEELARVSTLLASGRTEFAGAMVQSLAAKFAAAAADIRNDASTAERQIAALTRLIAIAKSDTGQSRRVADFLLSWWNSGSCGAFDPTNLWAVDRDIADDIVDVVALIATTRNYPTVLGLEDDFGQIIAQWRPELLA
jgi:hypothetical protein